MHWAWWQGSMCVTTGPSVTIPTRGEVTWARSPSWQAAGLAQPEEAGTGKSQLGCCRHGAWQEWSSSQDSGLRHVLWRQAIWVVFAHWLCDLRQVPSQCQFTGL